MPPAITGGLGEIQPLQHLITRPGGAPEHPPALESVDACRYVLYKTGQWRRAQSRRRCSLSGAAPREQRLLRPWHSPENTGTHISVDCEIGTPGRASPASRGRHLSKDF